MLANQLGKRVRRSTTFSSRGPLFTLDTECILAYTTHHRAISPRTCRREDRSATSRRSVEPCTASQTYFQPCLVAIPCSDVTCKCRPRVLSDLARVSSHKPRWSRNSICLPQNDLDSPAGSPISAAKLNTTRKTEKREQAWRRSRRNFLGLRLRPVPARLGPANQLLSYSSRSA